LGAVPIESVASPGSEPNERVRNLAAEAFGDFDVTGVLELSKMTREIAFGHAGFIQQVKKVGAINAVQEGKEHESGGFVDEPIDAAYGAHGIVHCASSERMGWARRYARSTSTPSATHDKPAVNSVTAMDCALGI
jgi:hypothetical protein